MKKLLVLTLTALTIAGLVGCGANDKKAEGNTNNSQIEQQADNKENKEEEMLFAKVTKTIGNEISVNLTDTTNEYLPAGDSAKLDESQENALRDGKTIQSAGSTTMGATTAEPAISDEEFQKQLEEGTASFGEVDQSVDPFEGISFDAGSKDFTISAGVKIFNSTTGKEGKLSDIKEGSVLGIIINKNANTITEVIILG